MTDPPFAPWESSDRREGPAVPISARREYVAEQYSDTDKLHIRIETHRLFSHGTESLFRLPKSVGWFVAETFA